ncbi:hypothetical protein ACTFIY_006789 [Dictyostelium cf. discoideum]
MNFNKLFVILSTIFFLATNYIKIGEASCSEQLEGYFNQKNQNVQLTFVRPQGDVVYISNTLSYYPYGSFLTNGNSFPALFSSKTKTTPSGVQPFDIDQKETSFYDRSGIILRQDGSLSMRALWSGPFNVNLTCTNSGSLNYGIADNGYLVSLQFK